MSCYSWHSAQRTALGFKLFEYNIFNPAYLIEYDLFGCYHFGSDLLGLNWLESNTIYN